MSDSDKLYIRTQISLDESYFGSRYQSDKRGRGAENKHIVFGIYKRNGKVYTEFVKNVKAGYSKYLSLLLPILAEKLFMALDKRGKRDACPIPKILLPVREKNRSRINYAKYRPRMAQRAGF